jgi:hypothetical protein
MTDDVPPPRDPFHVRVDLRDLLGAAGLVLTLGGAAAIHWGLALVVVGAGSFALAYKLSR